MSDICRVVFFVKIVFFSACFGEVFEVPALIENNVKFWKIIYSHISTEEGLIHDNEYPMIIYDTVKVGGHSPGRKEKINSAKADARSTISNMHNKEESKYDKHEKRVLDLFLKHASREELENASSRIRFQQGQKERFLEGLYRSGLFMDSIKIILDKYNVPLKLAYLPHVESSFDVTAYSKVGASGLWQFMRGTARKYLKIDYLVDERSDPILSTHAAAKLLAYNYSQLKRWPLAITAYNHGLYGMKRAVARVGSRNIEDIIMNHRSRSFRFASKNFYSCFLAACEIADNAEKHFEEVKYAPSISYRNIVLPYYISPSDFSAMTSIDKKDIMSLNPALRPVVFSQDRLIPEGTQIRIPADAAGADPSLINDILAAAPESLKIKTPPIPKYYRVRRGDNLYKIAYRFGVSAKDIAMSNNISSLNRIYAGQMLRLPVKGDTVKKAVSDVEEKEVAVSNKSKQISEKPADSKMPVDTGGIKDSLEDIIMTKADTLSRIENIIPPFFDAEVYDFDVHPYSSGQRAVISVSSEETLGHYADWLSIPTWRIRKLNHMGWRSDIHIGQELVIPLSEENIEEFSSKRIEYHMALEQDFYSNFKVTDVKDVYVERRQTLWDICHILDTIPLWLLKKYNKQNKLDVLKVDLKLSVPLIEENVLEGVKTEEGIRRWGRRYPYYWETIRKSSKPFRLTR